MTVADRLDIVRRGIDAACTAEGRERSSVSLIAVAKTHPLESVLEAHAVGQQHFGESYAQELRTKATAAPELSWHFIGRLQRNKAKIVAAHAFRVHSITSVAQAEALSSRRETELSVLVNVNLAAEPTKTGVAPTEVPSLIDGLDGVPRIRPVGLMCIPPAAEDPEQSSPWFSELAALAEAERARGHAITELSMGMSRDYAVAIRHGATAIRVGTAIFGLRR